MRGLSWRKRARNGLILALGLVREILGRERIGKRVIAFHEVKEPRVFRHKMEWLASHYEIVSVEELFSRPLGQKTQVAITFDDGYASWHEVVAPILAELDIPATFFFCSGFVGLKGQAARDFGQRYLHRQQTLCPISRAQLEELAGHPLFEIGSHTVHHVNLGQSPDEEMLAAEILGDKSRLEDWTGGPVRWFAYPFGGPQHVSVQAVGFVKGAGFRGAFTLMPGNWRLGDDEFRVGRDSLHVTQSVRLWQAWLGGGYDGLYSVKARWRFAFTCSKRGKQTRENLWDLRGESHGFDI